MPRQRIGTVALVLVMVLASVGHRGAAVGAKTPPPAEIPRILVQGADLHGANGLAFDDQDRLHVASWWGSSITVVDPDTGDILTEYGPDQGAMARTT
jgi:hypothetical protein